MKKLFLLLLFFTILPLSKGQEILSNVTVNAQQMAGSNQQVYKVLEKNIRDFINNTSWTGKKLENFEKLKANFALVITGRNGNKYNGSLVVQSVRPVFNSMYESPILNINDTKLSFEYVENENLIYNERQFSGKNLTDIIAFYVYVMLGYDADSFSRLGGTQFFNQAQKAAQNSVNNGYEGWAIIEGPRTRGSLLAAIINPNFKKMRNSFYDYHRLGLDMMYQQDQNPAKKKIADALQSLKTYENNFQQNYPLSVFIDVKSDEIFQIFDTNNNGSVNMNELKELMKTFAPKYTDSKWNKWK